MRSSVTWFVLVLILLLAASMSLAAQVGSSSPSSPPPSTAVTSAKSADAQAQTSDQGATEKGADVRTADMNGADTQTNDLLVEKSKIHWRLGTISVGAGYSSGPYFPYGYYPFGPYGYYPGDWVYSSFIYPLWGPYPFYPGSFAYTNGRGEVRLVADPKLAEVYIDGAYAGTADRLKSMWLDPGAYDLTVSSKDRESFHQRIYILSGKSLKITAKLGSDAGKEKL